MKKLKAQNGEAYHYRIDPLTRDRIAYLVEFYKAKLNLDVTPAVVLRRAVDNLTSYIERAFPGMGPDCYSETLRVKKAAEGGPRIREDINRVLAKWEGDFPKLSEVELESRRVQRRHQLGRLPSF